MYTERTIRTDCGQQCCFSDHSGNQVPLPLVKSLQLEARSAPVFFTTKKRHGFSLILSTEQDSRPTRLKNVTRLQQRSKLHILLFSFVSRLCLVCVCCDMFVKTCVISNHIRIRMQPNTDKGIKLILSVSLLSFPVKKRQTAEKKQIVYRFISTIQ